MDEFDNHSKLSEQILKTVEEFQAIFVRIFYIRRNAELDSNEIRRKIQNLSQELQRLDNDITILRERQVHLLENGLHLEEIGLPRDFVSSKIRRYETDQDVLMRDAYSAREEDSAVYSEADKLLEKRIGSKFMRTSTTAPLCEQTPKKKWGYLLDMFREWKQETNLASGWYISETKIEDIVDKEIAKIRSVVFSLIQSKTLSEEESRLLSLLQARLKNLLQIKRILSDAK
ncbi:uncharacterized protein LOC126325532 [Schistocerca gregaria]|uniref:uncharacterized protein LOC126325532 n=1 Tax=Schistocerca gregaria TaxID=7010 RepID=UPI00211EB4B6|nr:uncharacterized protein LOC126325532 [Schistocerca gregaria]